MVVGVNGTGKTTTIGKLAQVFRSDGKTVFCALRIPSARLRSSNWKFGGNAPGLRSFIPGRAEILGRSLRRLAGCERAPYRLCNCRYSRPVAHQDQSDAGTREDETDGAAYYSRCTTRDPSGDGRHHRTKWIATGASIYASGGRDRHRSYQTGRNSEGRGSGGNFARTRIAGSVCGSGREGRGPTAVQPARFCGVVVFVA